MVLIGSKFNLASYISASDYTDSRVIRPQSQNKFNLLAVTLTKWPFRIP